MEKKSFVREEGGFLKLFSAPKVYIKGLIGAGYDSKARVVKGYLFVHI